jgi:hypothetical protein
MILEEDIAMAEKHWEYTKKVSELSGKDITEREHFFYIQAMIHGIKHGMDKVRKQYKDTKQ